MQYNVEKCLLGSIKKKYNIYILYTFFLINVWGQSRDKKYFKCLMTIQTTFFSFFLFFAESEMLIQIELMGFSYMPEGIQIFTKNIQRLIDTHVHKDTQPFTALLEKGSYM